MASTLTSGLRSAASTLLAAPTVAAAASATRTWRLDLKRAVYLGGPDQGKKSRKKKPAVDDDGGGKAGRSNKTHLTNERMTTNSTLSQRTPPSRQTEYWDSEAVSNDGLAEALGGVSSNAKRSRDTTTTTTTASSSRDRVKNSPRPATSASDVVKINSLVDVIRMRREQASRTLLFVPDLAHAANPCPRYMRHKIESFVGRVPNVALTSTVTSSKSDIHGLPSVNPSPEKFQRKSLLVEFQNTDQMTRLIRDFSKPFPNDKVTFNNRLLYCHGRWSQQSSSSSSSSYCSELTEALNSCSDMNQQIQELLARTELDDAGIRARFFLCDVVESLIKSIFPGCHLIPFGSTLSGLGRADSDMDIVMRLAADNVDNDAPIFSAFSIRGGADGNDARSIIVRQLALIHEIMKSALPGYRDYNRIFRANVPIITFRHDYTNLCCDLSIQSNDSLIAAQLFYTYTLLDSRVRPLLFALRRWSIAQGLTSYVTNFPLCCLALFYLMEEKVVPPMDFSTGNSGNVSSIPTAIRWRSPNTEATLEDLLRGFFRFYSNFSFERDAISVFLGRRREKLTMDTVEVENPLARELNCARLIEHCNAFESFKGAIVAADEALQTKSRPVVGNEENETSQTSSSDENWGLSQLLVPMRRNKADIEADVFIDEDDETVVEFDGEFGVSPTLGGGGEAQGTIFRQQLRTRKTDSQPPPLSSSKRGEVLSILNEIFESEGVEKTPEMLEASRLHKLERDERASHEKGEAASGQELTRLKASTSRDGSEEEEEMTLNPTRFLEDEEVVMEEELVGSVKTTK